MATFDQALQHLRTGLPIYRGCWHPGRYLMHQPTGVESIHDISALSGRAYRPVWLVSVDDIMATDWILVLDKERVFLWRLKKQLDHPSPITHQQRNFYG